jgi:hypothetical protein
MEGPTTRQLGIQLALYKLCVLPPNPQSQQSNSPFTNQDEIHFYHTCPIPHRTGVRSVWTVPQSVCPLARRGLLFGICAYTHGIERTLTMASEIIASVKAMVSPVYYA